MASFIYKNVYINNILTDGDKFIDGDYDILLESLYEVHDYVIKNNMEYIKEFKYKQNIKCVNNTI